MLLGVSLPASLFAQQPAPAPTPLPQAAGAPAVVYVPVIAGNPYQAATPYNATVVSQAVPSPQLNRVEFTLPCNIPNQNLSPYTPTRPDYAGHLLGGGGCGGAGGGLFRGACSHPGSCATCCNTANFIFGSSRSFFGESSRDFFERPPAVDGIKHCPNKYAPVGGAAGGCGCGGR
jgi:hypothetical protein